MSEVLYNTAYYPSLLDIVKHCTEGVEDSRVIIGTKTFYFGLGGGKYELE